MKTSESVLILCQYPHGKAPGQRFRFEQYLGVLRGAGIEVTIDSFFSYSAWDILYLDGRIVRKTKAVLSGFLRRCLMLFRARSYDYILVYREASPVGPPIIECLLFLLGCRVVYDFDDAIFIPRTSRSNWFIAHLRWSSKIAYIARNAIRVSVSNDYLANWASRYNKDVRLIPTTIDPEYHKPVRRKVASNSLVIGWTGTATTLPYLDLIREPLVALQEEYEFVFCVIADQDPGFSELRNYRFTRWCLESEIEDLSVLDIGLMPVPNGVWEKGKAGFKAIQYSALEIVPVVSAVGTGREVVRHCETGLVVDNIPEEWFGALERLIKNPWEASSYGRSARKHILRNYSVPSQERKYLELFT